MTPAEVVDAEAMRHQSVALAKAMTRTLADTIEREDGRMVLLALMHMAAGIIATQTFPSSKTETAELCGKVLLDMVAGGSTP